MPTRVQLFSTALHIQLIRQHYFIACCFLPRKIPSRASSSVGLCVCTPGLGPAFNLHPLCGTLLDTCPIMWGWVMENKLSADSCPVLVYGFPRKMALHGHLVYPIPAQSFSQATEQATWDPASDLSHPLWIFTLLTPPPPLLCRIAHYATCFPTLPLPPKWFLMSAVELELKQAKYCQN